MKINVRVAGTRKVDEMLDAIPGAGKQVIEDATQVALKAARRQAKPHDEDTGDIAGGIKSELTGGVLQPVRGRIFTDDPGAGAAEMGRAPGRIPPLEPIIRFVRSHGIPVPPFVIARAIARRGTRAIRFMAQATRITKRQMTSIIQKAEKDLARRF